MSEYDMVYDKALLSKWMELRAEVFISKPARGFASRSISVDEIRKEFRIIAIELHQIMDGIYQDAQRNAPTKISEQNAIMNTE
jgi:hypothetical protein